MAQQTIFLGTNPNDGTGESLRGGGGKINANFTELYALQSQTINAGSVDYDFTGATIEQRIALADADAAARGFSRLYIPAFMLPYDITLCPASIGVQRVREGGDFTVYDLLAYGATPTGLVNTDPCWTTAVAAASVNGVSTLTGGIVFAPPGRYKTTQDIVVPVALDSGQVIIRGAGMRVTKILPSTPGQRGVLFGTATPDISGTFTNQTQYHGMEDITVSGTLLTSGTNIGIQFTEMQKGWLKNVLIEQFATGASIGLYLRGSTGSGAPHTWRCGFSNVLVATTKRPLVIENADENDYYNCNFHCPTGESTATYAIDVLQGRNNRWYGGLVQGDTNITFRPNYQGVRLRTPSVGDNAGQQFYGLVAEGFDIGLWIESSTVSDVWALGYNPSICRVAYYNGSEDGATSAERKNNVRIELVGELSGTVRGLRSGAVEASEIVGFANGDTTPSVKGGNVFYCGNTNPTSITAFDDGKNGQDIVVLLDGNTTIVHSSGLRCAGSANLVGTTNDTVRFTKIGGNWYQTSNVVTI